MVGQTDPQVLKLRRQRLVQPCKGPPLSVHVEQQPGSASVQIGFRTALHEFSKDARFASARPSRHHHHPRRVRLVSEQVGEDVYRRPGTGRRRCLRRDVQRRLPRRLNHPRDMAQIGHAGPGHEGAVGDAASAARGDPDALVPRDEERGLPGFAAHGPTGADAASAARGDPDALVPRDEERGLPGFAAHGPTGAEPAFRPIDFDTCPGLRTKPDRAGCVRSSTRSSRS